MREIKFRAWLKEEKIMIDVSEIDFRGEEVSEFDESDVFYEGYGYDYAELMQYTGLKDKNGKEIYEGDIVKWWGYEAQFGRQLQTERIIYINDYIKDAYKILCITEDTGQTVEVIGNIYEDKHLLEGEQCGI